MPKFFDSANYISNRQHSINLVKYDKKSQILLDMQLFKNTFLIKRFKFLYHIDHAIHKHIVL